MTLMPTGCRTIPISQSDDDIINSMKISLEVATINLLEIFNVEPECIQKFEISQGGPEVALTDVNYILCQSVYDGTSYNYCKVPNFDQFSELKIQYFIGVSDSMNFFDPSYGYLSSEETTNDVTACARNTDVFASGTYASTIPSSPHYANENDWWNYHLSRNELKCFYQIKNQPSFQTGLSLIDNPEQEKFVFTIDLTHKDGQVY